MGLLIFPFIKLKSWASKNDILLSVSMRYFFFFFLKYELTEGYSSQVPLGWGLITERREAELGSWNFRPNPRGRERGYYVELITINDLKGEKKNGVWILWDG